MPSSYSRRLRELSDPDYQCRRLVAIVLVLGTIIVLWYVTSILVSRSRPIFHLDDFHLSSQNSMTNTTTIDFDLKIRNNNSVVGIYYTDPLKLTFTYFPPTVTTNTNITIAEYTIQAFYQGNGKVKHVRDSVEVHQDLFNLEAKGGRRELGETFVSVMGPAKVVVLRVDLDGRIKFKSIENTKADVMVGAVVEVNGNTGKFVQRKSIELEYGRGSWYLGFWYYLLCVILICVFLVSGCICCVIAPAKGIGYVNGM